MSYSLKDNSDTDYDSISAVYDTSRQANNETVQKLVKLLHTDCESILVDIGCGTGNYTAAFTQLSRNIIGIDLSLGMLEQAKKKNPNSHFICGDVTALPFATEQFTYDFLKEAHRILKTGSYMALHSCSHNQMGAFWFYHYFPSGLEVDLERIPDTGEICLLLEKAGFANIGVEICYHDVVVSDETPECYLDKNYRDGVSTFAFLTTADIELGCDKIRRDIFLGDAERIVQQCEAKVLSELGGSSIIYGQKMDPFY